MCGRYFLISSPAELAETFDVSVRDNFPPRYNIAPTQPIAIIRQNPLKYTPDPEYALVRWGFIPAWSKDGHMNVRPLVNARSETVAEKNSFKSAYRRRRCLIPANGFYEWQTNRGAKQPFAIWSRSSLISHNASISEGSYPLFAFAGIWEHWMGADGSEMESAAILTRNAGSDLQPIHHREPIIVRPDKYADWLHADERDKKQYAPVLDTEMAWQTRRIGRAVGNVRIDHKNLLNPLIGEQGSLF